MLTVAKAIEVFTKAKRPFVGKLIAVAPPPGYTGKVPACPYCAQGLVLHESGCSDMELRDMKQADADARVAKLLGISRAESILLRRVNDSGPGMPQAVLILSDEGIGSVIGAEWRKLVSFWRHMDTLDENGWKNVAAARDAAGAAARDAAQAAAWAAARDAARAAAWAAAGDAARDAAVDAAWDAAVDAAVDAAGAAAGYASDEIIGASKLTTFVFLPMFGFANPSAIPLHPDVTI